MNKISTLIFCMLSSFAIAGVMEVTDANFAQEVEKASQPVVVDVYATWCKPCQQMGPIFEAVSNDFPKVKFVKVNFDKTKDACNRLGVSSLPTFLFMKNGQEVERQVGMMTKEEFASKIKQTLGQ